eukprot:3496326-Rhodomonas_salina.8
MSGTELAYGVMSLRFATRCPVLTWRMVLCPYASATGCAVLWCYGMCAYGAMRRAVLTQRVSCNAMCGTEMQSAVLRQCLVLHFAMGCPVAHHSEAAEWLHESDRRTVRYPSLSPCLGGTGRGGLNLNTINPPCVRARYALSGTDLAYGATRRWRLASLRLVSSAACLRAC